MKTARTNPLTTIVLGGLIFTAGIVLATTFGNWIVAVISALIGFGAYSGVYTGRKTGALAWAIVITTWLLFIMYANDFVALMSILAVHIAVSVAGGILIGAGDKSRDKATNAK